MSNRRAFISLSLKVFQTKAGRIMATDSAGKPAEKIIRILLSGIFLLGGACSSRHLYNVHDECPAWVDHVPESTDEYLFFVGVSHNHAEERDARRAALIDSINKFAGYCGVNVSTVYRYLSVSLGRASQVSDPGIGTESREEHVVRAFVSRVKAKEWCVQRIENPGGSNSYRAYVLATVPAGEVRKVQEYMARGPLTFQLRRLEGDAYCIEVRSTADITVKGLRLMDEGTQIFPNPFCVPAGDRVDIQDNVASLDFSSASSILLGGNTQTFKFCVKGEGTLEATYFFEGQTKTYSLRY